MDAEFMNATIHGLDKQVAVLQTRLDCTKEALELQATKYEQRLQEAETRHRALELVTASLTQRTWISIGAAITGGGVGAFVMKLIG